MGDEQCHIILRDQDPGVGDHCGTRKIVRIRAYRELDTESPGSLRGWKRSRRDQGNGRTASPVEGHDLTVQHGQAGNHLILRLVRDEYDRRCGPPARFFARKLLGFSIHA